MSSRPFRLGDERPWGETTCGYGPTTPECSKPATIHVLWLEPLATSNTCDEHMVEIEQRAEMPYETHPFEGECGMPGTLWHHPYEDEEHGYCLFPAVDDASIVAVEEQVAP